MLSPTGGPDYLWSCVLQAWRGVYIYATGRKGREGEEVRGRPTDGVHNLAVSSTL